MRARGVAAIEAVFSARDNASSGDAPARVMPFVVAGDPSLDATAAVIRELDSRGASAIEIGIPFSDPIADGPVIAAAMHRALECGVTPAGTLDMVRAVRTEVSIPLIAMVSMSIVARLGGAEFVRTAADAGIDGFIVPDTDDSDADVLATACDEAGLAFASLIAPTTSDERIAVLTTRSRGFVYLLARAGITGASGDAPPEIAARVNAVRRRTTLPIAVGFGISNAQHVAAVTAHADAAIVGSALVKQLAGTTEPAAAATIAGRILDGLRG